MQHNLILCCSSSAGETESFPIGQLTILPYGKALGWQRAGSIPDSSRVIGVVYVKASMPGRCRAPLISEQFLHCPNHAMRRQSRHLNQLKIYITVSVPYQPKHIPTKNKKPSISISDLAVHWSCQVHCSTKIQPS